MPTPTKPRLAAQSPPETFAMECERPYQYQAPVPALRFSPTAQSPPHFFVLKCARPYGSEPQHRRYDTNIASIMRQVLIPQSSAPSAPGLVPETFDRRRNPHRSMAGQRSMTCAARARNSPNIWYIVPRGLSLPQQAAQITKHYNHLT